MGVLEFPYPLRFLFAPRPEVLTQVLGVVYPTISTYLVRRARLRVGASARTGAITLIQRFGSALNPNIHLHMLAVDGVYTTPSTVPVPRRRARPNPTSPCAVRRRRPSAGANPARQLSLQPVAVGAGEGGNDDV